jgi:hypothetical protein
MVTLLFLFTRKDGFTPAAFKNHYLGVHAPMAVKHSRTTNRYVVRLTEGGSGPFPLDAMTEIWAPSVEEFFDPDRSFDSPQSFQDVTDDAARFLAGFYAYQVESTVVAGEVGAGEDGGRGPAGAVRSPGVAVTELFTAGDPADAGRGARHRLDGLVAAGAQLRTRTRFDVVGKLSPDGPDLTAAEVSHFSVVADSETAGMPAYLMGEYVQKNS